MIKELQEFFEACPYLKKDKQNIDFLGRSEGCYTIETVPCEPILKRYKTGGSLRQYCFLIGLRQRFDGSVGENLKNEQLCEEIADWVEECSNAGKLPRLEKGRVAQKISVTSSGYMFDESVNHARYQIGLRLVYTKI
ncbi:MAG: chloramphenicol resistance protein [Clostridia bacterium]|nr:chloramphenicol resistance protein [Clostridia bacterium]